MKNRKTFIAFVIFALQIYFLPAFNKNLYNEFSDFNVRQSTFAQDGTEFVCLYSDAKKSLKLICLPSGSQVEDYSLIFENKAKMDWCQTAIIYSEKSDTLYFHLNADCAKVNGEDIYYDLGLYSFSRIDGEFCKDGMKRYIVPEDWMFKKVWNAFVGSQNYSDFLDFVYSIGDSCEKVFSATNENGNLLLGEPALKYVAEKKLYDGNVYDFLNKYMCRVENEKVTRKSAYTLNGNPEIRHNLVKDSIYSCVFLQSDDGIWIIREHTVPKVKINENNKKVTVYESDYYIPLLLEDEFGKIVTVQPEILKDFTFAPSVTINDCDENCLVLNGCLLMRDRDENSFWIYNDGILVKKESFQEATNFANANKNSVKISKNFTLTDKNPIVFVVFLAVVIILVILLVLAVIYIFVLKSKQYERHLNKKDKKLIFGIENKERSIIAKDLHDSVVQNVRAILIDVEMLNVNGQEEIKKNMIISKLTDSIVLLRNICYSLSPAEISLAENTNTPNVELISVIDTLCKQFAHKTKIPCILNMNNNLKIPSFEMESSKFVIRTFQEILTNIEKHSFATRVNVFLSNELLEEKAMLKIVVIDDGIGCEIEDLTKNKHHFGIRNIMDYMKLIEGKVEFYTKPGEGMNIVVKVPYN